MISNAGSWETFSTWPSACTSTLKVLAVKHFHYVQSELAVRRPQMHSGRVVYLFIHLINPTGVKMFPPPYESGI